MTKPPDDRPPLVQAMEWTSRIATVALQMVLPGLAGYWVDTKLGTKFVFLLLGTVLGFITGMRQLLRWSQPTGGPHDDSGKV